MKTSDWVMPMNASTVEKHVNEDPQGPERRLSGIANLLHQGLSANEAALRFRVEEHAAETSEPFATLGDPDALWRAAVGFDAEALTRALDEGFALAPFDEVVDGWLLPSLFHLGLAWSRDEVSVAEEHFASASVHRRLATIFDEAPRHVHAERVLVGLAPGSRHELGVLAFAIALRHAGVDAVYLGGDVPVSAWVDSVTRRSPAAVVIAVPAKEDVRACRELAATLAEAAPDLPLLVGGSYQDQISDHVTKLGHQVAPAASRLAAAVRAKV